MTQDTNTASGAAIKRYKIGYHTDEWGVRSSTPGGITDPSGQWVLYKDHIAALASHGQAPASKIEGLTAAQESLGVEFEKVLHDNLFDLYEESAPHGQAPAQAAPAAVAGCTRSHPHENMDSACRAKASIAEMRNKAARGAEATAHDLDRFVVMLTAAPTPPTQTADSVLEDAARLDWLDQQCEAYGFQDIHEGNRWEISGPYANVRVAIDAERAARKQGANHD